MQWPSGAALDPLQTIGKRSLTRPARGRIKLLDFMDMRVGLARCVSKYLPILKKAPLIVHLAATRIPGSAHRR